MTRKRRRHGDPIEQEIELVLNPGAFIPYGACLSFVSDLAKLKRDLRSKLGRGDQALDAAWSDDCTHPGTYTCDDLMKHVPKDQRKAWHEKAIEAAMGADLHSIMDLLLETKELDRLAELVRRTRDDELEDLSHYAGEPVAKKLEKRCYDSERTGLWLNPSDNQGVRFLIEGVRTRTAWEDRNPE